MYNVVKIAKIKTLKIANRLLDLIKPITRTKKNKKYDGAIEYISKLPSR